MSDTTLTYDQQTRLPQYARAGVPEVWIVALEHELVLVYRDPTPDGYRLTASARRGDTLSPAALPDVVIAVDDILG